MHRRLLFHAHLTYAFLESLGTFITDYRPTNPANMSLRTSARTLAPFFKQTLRAQPLASTSKLASRPNLPLSVSSTAGSLPYAQFSRRFKSTTTTSGAESSAEEGTSTKLKFEDENGNPLRIEPKLQVPLERLGVSANLR